METTPPNISGHPWMRHAETGNYAQLPDIGYWRGNGWEPVDGPPPEPDATRDPLLKDPEAPAEPGLSAAKIKKSAAAKTSAKTEEEEA